MKRMIYILAVVMAVGCHRSMAPWPGDGDQTRCRHVCQNT